MQSGGAIIAASDLVIEHGPAARRAFPRSRGGGYRVLSAHAAGFSIAGTDRGIGIMELAARCAPRTDLPDDLPRTLRCSHVFKGVPSAFPNGCHSRRSNRSGHRRHRIVSYTMVNDFGVLSIRLLVEGQAHGGIAQGIGQALLENVVYDDDGQPLTGSYMDYALPRASDLPALGFHSHPVPCPTNPLGAKGCGEAGCAGSMPSVMNAVVDALTEFGITHIDMPATPRRVWEAIQAARSSHEANRSRG